VNRVKYQVMEKIITNNEKETQEVGGRLWKQNEQYLGKQAVVFALEGELGAGKTQLVKGLAKAMGIKDDVISPTFTLEAEYGLGKLAHIDAWRIEDSRELLEIGFEKRIMDKQVIVVEWADQVKDVLEKVVGKIKIVWVKLSYGAKDDERIIEIK